MMGVGLSKQKILNDPEKLLLRFLCCLVLSDLLWSSEMTLLYISGYLLNEDLRFKYCLLRPLNIQSNLRQKCKIQSIINQSMIDDSVRREKQMK